MVAQNNADNSNLLKTAHNPEDAFRDILYQSTKYLKLFSEEVSRRMETIGNSRPVRILQSTTQPAHLIIIIAVSLTTFLLFPNGDLTPKRTSTLLAFFYLACYGTHLGSQVWMTFVSGLSLYFKLERHTFGRVQNVLFPRYFLFNSILSFFTMAAFLQSSKDKTDIYHRLQGVNLAATFLLELSIRLYLTPSLILLVTSKNKMEAENGCGLEIGCHIPGTLASSEEYRTLHKTFRRVHMKIAIGNMITMACTVFHLHYLALRLSS